ncbi:MAG: hypothetical protein HC828_00725 [Blastochloris sp.]|nr:hypothetical protein [Blastochloris sp.]
MNIQLQFDRDKLLQRAQQGKPLVFDIAWEHEGVYYPAPYWADFGVVILSWWLRSVVEIAEEGASEFLFMDGPYRINAKYDENTKYIRLTPKGQDWVWVVPIDMIAHELIRAANAISRELLANDIGVSERQSLEYGVSSVRKAIFDNSSRDR